MYYILYISAAATWMDESALNQILAASRVNNKRNEITGLLLYGHNSFIQLLEGENRQVKQTFDRIRADERHLDMNRHRLRKLQSRCFPDWEMGLIFRELSDRFFQVPDAEGRPASQSDNRSSLPCSCNNSA